MEYVNTWVGLSCGGRFCYDYTHDRNLFSQRAAALHLSLLSASLLVICGFIQAERM